ncbi:M23 family metallopeptidase [Mucilaginibacter sp. Mucisp84]|uniref:M23 family metallopeptidase n=1 Tax=Mucilaginibacter sp. Mucisp84 TaxID=3243058 RepID=UPI0039A5F7C6
MPLKHLVLTSGYGYRIHPVTAKFSFHPGVDLHARHDTVFAIADGVVAAIGYQDLLGICIRLNHNGLQSVYGHLSQVWVSAGDSVISGQPIAISGATGRVTGEHLHFSVLYLGKPIDPIQFLYHLLSYNQNHE